MDSVEAIVLTAWDGTSDLNIAIRTIFCRGGRASYHVGSCIVWVRFVRCVIISNVKRKCNRNCVGFYTCANPGYGLQ